MQQQVVHFVILNGMVIRCESLQQVRELMQENQNA